MGIRIDALDPTSTPTTLHELPAMKDGLTVKLRVEQILELAGVAGGDLAVNKTSPTLFLNTPTDGLFGSLAYELAGKKQWTLGPTGAGANLGIQRYDAGGLLVDTPMTIDKATGKVNFAVAPTIGGSPMGGIGEAPADGHSYLRANSAWSSAGTLVGPLSINGANPVISLNKPTSGQSNLLSGMFVGMTRWAVNLGDGSNEGGANAGSNFAIQRYDDAGALIDSPLAINRATGLISAIRLSASSTPAKGTALVASNGVQSASFATSDNYAMKLGGPAQITGDLLVQGNLNGGSSTILTIPDVYSTTAGAAANVYVYSSGRLARATGSTAEIKGGVEPLWDAIGDLLLQFKPIFYRYTVKTIEPSSWSWYGLTAEDVAELDPRFANWDQGLVYKDGVPSIEDGEIKLEDGASPQSINWPAVTTALINLVQRLERRVAALEGAR